MITTHKHIATPEIIIAFSLLKEQKLDYLLQKATEVGASGFIPFMSKRSIIKFDFKKEDSKIDRWYKILKEASEQCFRVDVPNISNENMAYRITDTEETYENIEVYYFKYKNQIWILADCLVGNGTLYVTRVE